jgi:hypothetical protein
MNIVVRGLTPTQAAARERHLRFRRDIAEKAEALAKSKPESACDQMLAAMAAESRALAVEPAPVEPGPPKSARWFGPIEEIGPPPLTARRIQDEVCRRYNMTRPILLGPSRRAQYVQARFIAFHLCRQLLGLSLPYIGHRFNRDHSTVLSGLKKIGRLLRMQPDLAQEVTELIEQLGGQPQ